MAANVSERLPKRFRLSGPATVDGLFAFKPVVSAYPIKLFCKLVPQASTAGPLPAALIAVPKRQVRLATGRNRIRRQLRDVLRRHIRPALLATVARSGQDWQLAVLYTGGKTVFSYAQLQTALVKALAKLAQLPVASLPGYTAVAVGDGAASPSTQSKPAADTAFAIMPSILPDGAVPNSITGLQ